MKSEALNGHIPSNRRHVRDRADRDFLEGLCLLATATHCQFFIYDAHINIVLSKLYLIEVDKNMLRLRVDVLWDNRKFASVLKTFINDQENWFYWEVHVE